MLRNQKEACVEDICYNTVQSRTSKSPLSLSRAIRYNRFEKQYSTIWIRSMDNSTSVGQNVNLGTTSLGDGVAKPVEEMQQLLEKANGYRVIRRGEIVEGIVMRVDKDGILVNVGLKSEGIIPGREMRTLSPESLERLKVGDELIACVVLPENEEGQVELSLDRAAGEKGWRILQRSFEKGELFEGPVVDYNKGGVIVEIEGIKGFVPSSQLVGLPARDEQASDVDSRFSQMLHKQLKLKVIDLNRRRNRIILSEKIALQEWRIQQKEKLLNEIKEGEVHKGKVTGVREFGAFVDLGGADGLVHLSELSWNRVNSPEEIVKTGDEVDVYVVKVDRENKKIALSIKRTKPEPWATINERYQVGQLVTGTITKLTPFGAFAQIENSVEGLIHISELSNRSINHPKEVVKEGDVVDLKILRIEPERRRLGLSLKQVETD